MIRLTDPTALSWSGFLGLAGLTILFVSFLERGMIIHVSFGITSGFNVSFADSTAAGIVLVGEVLFDAALVLKALRFVTDRFKTPQTPRVP